MPFDSPDPAAFFLALAFRSTLLLAAALLATVLLRRGSAAIRHMIWAAAILCLLALPILSSLPGLRVLPQWTAPEPVVQLMAMLPRPIADPASHAISTTEPSLGNAGGTVASVPANAGSGRPFSLTTLLAALWFAGVGIALLPPILGRILLAKIQRRASALTDPPIRRVLDQASCDLGIRRPVSLLLGEPNTMPMAWGLLSPRILLPREAVNWPASRLRAVLLHELAHIKRHDCFTHLLAQIARAVYWPNPLAWLAVRALHTERERACDDMVLHAGEQSTDYASQLLSLASGRLLSPASAAAMAMARPSQLEHRIRSILDTQRSRSTMNRKQLFIAAGLALAVVLPIAGLKSALVQPEKAERQWPPAPVEPAPVNLKPGEQTNYTRSAGNMRRIIEATHGYAKKHDGLMPPSLGATLPYIELGELDKEVPTSKAAVFLSPADQKTVAIPAEVTPEWVEQNSSYVYLGGGEIKVSDIPDWATTAILYEKLDRPYLVMYTDNTVHPWYCVGFPQCSITWAASREQAESMIRESRATLDAMRTGGEIPDDKQIVWQLQEVSQAVRAYAKDHNGMLPPDLGATLPYVVADGKRLATAAQRAAIYLAPTARRGVKIPEEPTAEWVNQNTSYTYLGGADVRLDRVAFQMQTVLIYDDLRRGDTLKTSKGDMTVVPFLRVQGNVERMQRKSVEEMIENSKAVFEFARNGGTLPDLPQAINDTQILASAIGAYAKAHGDAAPPDVGAALPYLDRKMLPADNAAELAKVFLSPAAERTATLPSEVTPEWINEHCNYVYLGAGHTLTEIVEATETNMLIHSPVGEDLHMPAAYGDGSWIAMGDTMGSSAPWSKWQFDRAMLKLADLRNGRPTR